MPYMKLNPHLPQIIETLREDGQKAHPRDIRTAVDELESMARRIDALEELAERLTAERDEMRRQRDEARREVCKRVESASCLSDGEPTTLASDYARWCGWDCFKEDGK
jgi:FtsZ-binding cell division protein ZapB